LFFLFLTCAHYFKENLLLFMKPTLVILAAGIGSRYGGVKQMDKIGPSGESIIDYSVFDAIRAGFGKVVFVLNPKIIDDFKQIYEARLKGKIETSYVLQELHNIPEGVSFNPERVKPWGTGHAVLVTKDVVSEPFAVINADDFYGKHAFELISGFLSKLNNEQAEYAMVGYKLKNTLSDHGSVSRGVCQLKNGLLTDVVERTSIVRKGQQVVFQDEGKEVEIDENSVVSMNFWGFTPKYFEQSEKDFKDFIEENANQLKAEFYIPTVANNLITKKEATIRVLTSNDQWFGVTYQEDKPTTIANIRKLVEEGKYPENLWA
jgi:NDP-sugar pyrophosphorylase family protein